MTTRLPPKAMAKKLVRVLRTQHPDAHYLKKVFQHTRTLLAVEPNRQPKRMPELLSDVELVVLYETIWQARHLTHVVMLKLLLFTGLRNAELVRLRLTEVDLATCQLRISQGKGHKDRYGLFPMSFRGELAQYMERQQGAGGAISLSPIAVSHTPPDASARSSNSMRTPQAWRSGSIRISSGISSSRISRSRASLVPNCSCSAGIRPTRASRSTASSPCRMSPKNMKWRCSAFPCDNRAMASYRSFPPVGPNRPCQ